VADIQLWQEASGYGWCGTCGREITYAAGLCEAFSDPQLEGRRNIRLICIDCAKAKGYEGPLPWSHDEPATPVSGE
jgi:hypothetical protein